MSFVRFEEDDRTIDIFSLGQRYYYEKCPEIISEHKTVYVGIALYLMNLHSVDLKSGTFHADFYLYFKGQYF